MLTSTANLRAEDDGLTSPEVRRWAEEKYRLISLYDELFASGMKYKWDQRVYIDLYAGAGISRIQGTDTYLKGSPVLALAVSCPFDKYIFCEGKPELLEVLKKWSKALALSRGVAFIPGSCDIEIDKLCAAIPKGSARRYDSISDFFQDKIPVSFISQVATTMRRAHWRTYQVLTKRSKRMREVLARALRECSTELASNATHDHVVRRTGLRM